MYCSDRDSFKFDDDEEYYYFTRNHLSISRLAYIQSIDFLKITLDNLHKMFSNQISEIIDYIKTVSGNVPYFRKFEIVNIEDNTNDIYMEVFKIFLFYLQERITRHFSTSNWDFVEISDISNQSFYQIARKVMVSNMIINPVVLKEHAKLNMLSLPLHVPVEKPQISKHAPESILYLGKYHIQKKKKNTLTYVTMQMFRWNLHRSFVI